MNNDNNLPQQLNPIQQQSTNSNNKNKSSKNKSLNNEVIEMLEGVIIYIIIYFLAVSIPLGISFLAIDYFTDWSILFTNYQTFFVIILLLLLVVAYEIRKTGVKKFWKRWINRIPYPHPITIFDGKYYKPIVYGLVLVIFFTLLISTVFFYILQLFIKW